MGQEKVDEYNRNWRVLIDKVKSEMKKGTYPKSSAVQDLAAEWNSHVRAFTGGSPQIRFSLQEMYRQEPQVGEKYGIDPEIGSTWKR